MSNSENITFNKGFLISFNNTFILFCRLKIQFVPCAEDQFGITRKRCRFFPFYVPIQIGMIGTIRSIPLIIVVVDAFLIK